MSRKIYLKIFKIWIHNKNLNIYIVVYVIKKPFDLLKYWNNPEIRKYYKI